MFSPHRWLPGVTFISLWIAATGVLFLRQDMWSPNRQQPIDITVLSGDFDQAQAAGEFHGAAIASTVVAATQPEQAPPAADPNRKRIEVDLAQQRLYAYEGDTKIYDFLISSGKWGRTPTGTFTIWGKFRYTKMSGGSKELRTYYYLPNVPFVMFFSNDKIPAARGFGIHGTYWHENFGHPMSHGCINMKTEEAELIYNWSTPFVGDAKSMRASKDNPGTEVVIYGVAPKE